MNTKEIICDVSVVVGIGLTAWGLSRVSVAMAMVFVGLAMIVAAARVASAGGRPSVEDRAEEPARRE